MTEKVIGYVLLVVGIIMISFSGLSVYNVFKGNERPYRLFNFDAVNLSLDPSQFTGGTIQLPQELIDAGVSIEQNSNQKPIQQEILPSNILNDTTNIFAHLMLMGFVASIGYRFASIGTQMVRPIVVKSSAYKVTSSTGKTAAVSDKSKGKTAT